jgi:hypothetical protein
MRLGLLACVLLIACGSPPAAACRSNDDCPADRVCIAGACGDVPGADASTHDVGTGVDGDAARLDGAGLDGASDDAPLGPPPGESCANPILLQPVAIAGENPTVRWTGELGDYHDDAFPDCSGPDVGAPDILFEIERPADVSDLIITTSPAGLDTIMAVDGTCDASGFSWACNDDRDPDPGGGGDVSSGIFLWHFDPSLAEHLYLIVDGGRRTVTSGTVSVQVEVRSASSSDCTGPLDLSGGGTMLAFAPSFAPPDLGDCTGDPSSGDLVFRFGDGTRPPGRFSVESSDYPVSLRLVGGVCGPSTTCAATMGGGGYWFTDFGPFTEAGASFIAVEGITARTDGNFELDYDP